MKNSHNISGEEKLKTGINSYSNKNLLHLKLNSPASKKYGKGSVLRIKKVNYRYSSNSFNFPTKLGNASPFKGSSPHFINSPVN